MYSTRLFTVCTLVLTLFLFASIPTSAAPVSKPIHGLDLVRSKTVAAWRSNMRRRLELEQEFQGTRGGFDGIVLDDDVKREAEEKRMEEAQANAIPYPLISSTHPLSRTASQHLSNTILSPHLLPSSIVTTNAPPPSFTFFPFTPSSLFNLLGSLVGRRSQAIKSVIMNDVVPSPLRKRLQPFLAFPDTDVSAPRRGSGAGKTPAYIQAMIASERE